MSEPMGDWEKILITALVVSFFTACVTEPVKAFVQSRMKRRELRLAVYHEISANATRICFALKKDDWSSFSWSYQHLAYDFAKWEIALFQGLGHMEIDSIIKIYTAFESMTDGKVSAQRHREIGEDVLRTINSLLDLRR